MPSVRHALTRTVGTGSSGRVALTRKASAGASTPDVSPREPESPLRGRDSLVREPNTDVPLQFPTWGRAVSLIGRALRVRCPHCGGGPVLVHWLKMRDRCGTCDLALQRGEGDYFLGAMMFNLVLAELVFVGILVTSVAVRWPVVPWEGLQIGAPIGMLVAPIVLFPVSRLSWLAFDLAFRPEPASHPPPGATGSG